MRSQIGLIVVALATGCATTPVSPTQPAAETPAQAGRPAAVADLLGEWHLGRIDGRAAPSRRVLTVWGSSFGFGAGCDVAHGYLRDLPDGRIAIKAATGVGVVGCATLTPPPPFDGEAFKAELIGSDALRIRADGPVYLFAKVDPGATIASEDFVRGEWLLADERGRPYRSKQLTRVSFNERGWAYRVHATHCSYETDGWIADRDWIVRPGGSLSKQTRDCRATTLGDRLAMQGSDAKLIAEPVEGRFRVKIDSRAAWLVPAARFPELSLGASSYPVNNWARRLGEAGKAAYDGPLLVGYALRAVALAAGPRNEEDRSLPDARRQAFAGLTVAQYRAAQDAGLLPRADDNPRTLAGHLASAPIVALAVLEGIEAAERSDGMSLDYHYRVREGWRGGKRPGDLVIVRMPSLSGKSRSPVITPQTGDEVLLLASRTGYIAGRLIDGYPPSADRRVTQMTLPLMRVRGGRLVEAVEGADVLGAAAFSGTTLEEARKTALGIESRIAAIRASGNERRTYRYFLTHVGGRALADPAHLWIDFDPDLKTSSTRRLGGVVAYWDGCNVTSRSGTFWIRTDVGCIDPAGNPMSESAVGRTAEWIEENGIPVTATIGGPGQGPFEPIEIPTPEGAITLRQKFE